MGTPTLRFLVNAEVVGEASTVLGMLSLKIFEAKGAIVFLSPKSFYHELQNNARK